MGTRRGCNHKSAGLRLPPGIDDGALISADFFVIPHPCFRIDRLAYRTENPHRVQLIFGGPFVAQTHQGPDGCWCRIENCNAELIANMPETTGVRVGGNSLEHQRCAAVCKRAINNVAVPRYPADIGGTPVNIIVVNIEDDFMSKRGVQQISTCCVDDALGFAG